MDNRLRDRDGDAEWQGAFRDAREQGRQRGRALLPKVWQTVTALQAAQERSQAYLLPDGVRRPDDVGTGVAPIARTEMVKDPVRSYGTQTYTTRQVLAGWRIAYQAANCGGFIFQIPVDGDPTVKQYDGGIPMSLLMFVEGGAYEAVGPSAERVLAGADTELAGLMRLVDEHLALLGHRAANGAL